MSIRKPKWLATELDDYGRRVRHGELQRPEAVGQLSDDVFAKDEELTRAIVTAWVSDELTKGTERLARAGRKEAERTQTAYVQGAFDDECSYFFPPDTFPLTVLLEEAETHAADLFGRAERHKKVAENRVRYVERMRAAVGPDQGDRKATLAEGVAALRASGEASG